MSDPVGMTAISIQHDMQRMNSIANNAANALTPGFKREYLTTTGSFGASLYSAMTAGSTIPAVPLLRNVIDSHPGVARQTGSPLDLALLGEGYFEIKTDAGLAYTRQGTFKLDEQGRLVNQGGFPVAGIGGDILLSSPNPIIDRDGRITEQGKQVGQIKVVSFDSPQTLTSIGGGLYVSAGGIEKHDIQRPRMAQGQLESSNVDSTQEMVRMLEAFRHFETSHRVLQAYDDLNEKTLRSLGQF